MAPCEGCFPRDTSYTGVDPKKTVGAVQLILDLSLANVTAPDSDRIASHTAALRRPSFAVQEEVAADRSRCETVRVVLIRAEAPPRKPARVEAARTATHIAGELRKAGRPRVDLLRRAGNRAVVERELVLRTVRRDDRVASHGIPHTEDADPEVGRRR